MTILQKATNTPRHVAIIMDGNGRWAGQRGLPRIEGHRRGRQAIQKTLEGCRNLGIRFLTLYAFSTENWRRPKEEIDALMELLETFLRQENKHLHRHRIRLRAIGRIEDLPPGPREALRSSVESTASYTDWNLTLALNYSSRQEVVDATLAYARFLAETNQEPGTLSWEEFSRFLYTSDIPEPDLLIRTSGEFRLSNFLLLQSAYAELYFSPVLWPDFDDEELLRAVETFRRRERRYGLTSEQCVDSDASPQEASR